MPSPLDITVALADLEYELAIEEAFDQAFDEMARAPMVPNPIVLPITCTDAKRGLYVVSPTPIERWDGM